MRYQVRFVSDHSLPNGVTWAFARQAGETFLFVRQSAIDASTGRCAALSRAWEAWQAAEAQSARQGLSGFTTGRLAETRSA